MRTKSIIAYFLIGIPFLVVFYFIINSKQLIPNGYELAVDGYIVSRTILLIFGLYLIFKLGLFLLKKNS